MLKDPQRPNAHEVSRYRAVTGKKEETAVAIRCVTGCTYQQRLKESEKNNFPQRPKLTK